MEIDYEKIDIESRPMVKYFNSIGLTTKFSCSGHDNKFRNVFSIMFDDNISDEHIELFVKNLTSKYRHTQINGKFTKWCRVMSDEIVYNWIYDVNTGSYLQNQRMAMKDLRFMVSRVNKKSGNGSVGGISKEGELF